MLQQFFLFCICLRPVPIFAIFVSDIKGPDTSNATLQLYFNMICDRTWNILSVTLPLQDCDNLEFFDIKAQYNFKADIICDDIPDFGYGPIAISRSCNGKRDQTTQPHLTFKVRVSRFGEHTQHLSIAPLVNDSVIEEICESGINITDTKTDIGVLNSDVWYLVTWREQSIREDCVVMDTIVFSTFFDVENKTVHEQYTSKILNKVEREYLMPLNMVCCRFTIAYNFRGRYNEAFCDIDNFCMKKKVDCYNGRAVLQTSPAEETILLFTGTVIFAGLTVVFLVVIALVYYQKHL